MLKKSLGQHLLTDRNLLVKMVRLAGVGSDDDVVEIGPGRGNLTRCLAEAAHSVYAIELDETFREDLVPLMDEFPNLKVVFRDVLKVRLAEHVRERRLIVMGNIPYNITGEILFKVLEEKQGIEKACFTMQKEVAQRIVSLSHRKSYGALSVIFQLYADTAILLTLKPRVFIPPPKVESAFLSVGFKDHMAVDKDLVEFVKGCFRYKRKYLRHSLEKHYPGDRIESMYSEMGFSPSTRAEEIEPETFERMYRYMEREYRA